MTINQAQDLRKEGFTVVMNSTYTKVLLTTKNENEAYDLKRSLLLKKQTVKILVPLVRMGVTNDNIREALAEPITYHSRPLPLHNVCLRKGLLFCCTEVEGRLC